LHKQHKIEWTWPDNKSASANHTHLKKVTLYANELLNNEFGSHACMLIVGAIYRGSKRKEKKRG